MKLASKIKRTYLAITIFSLITIVLVFSTISFNFAKNRIIQKTVDEAANVLKQVSQSYISCEELGNKLVLVENEVLDVELRDASDVIFNFLKESNVKINSSGHLGNIYYQILENNSVNEDIINKRYNIKLSGQKTSEYKTVTNKINGNDNIVDRVYVRKFENVLPNTMESTDGIFLILTVSKKSKVERAFKNFNALNAMDNQPFNNFGIFYVYEKGLGIIFASDDNSLLEESYFSENMSTPIVEIIETVENGYTELNYYNEKDGSVKRVIFNVEYDSSNNNYYILEIDKDDITKPINDGIKIVFNFILVLYFIYTAVFYYIVKTSDNKINTSYWESDDV
jgi:phenylalanyl-tRNA synthetase alpha subunit